jgi:RNA polymerase sigma-70 factor (ECF subfamily)
MVSRSYFEQTALVHIDFLYNLALKITRNEDDAQDLVQETYLRAYRFFDKYEPGTNCKAWLYRIMKNTFINHYRKQHRRPSEVDFDSIEETQESHVRSDSSWPQNPEQTLINSIIREDVRNAFLQLPQGYREALALSLLGGKSYKEIADMMDCPIGTIMSRIHRARKLMQKQLTEHAEEKSWVVPSEATQQLAQGA